MPKESYWDGVLRRAGEVLQEKLGPMSRVGGAMLGKNDASMRDVTEAAMVGMGASFGKGGLGAGPRFRSTGDAVKYAKKATPKQIEVLENIYKQSLYKQKKLREAGDIAGYGMEAQQSGILHEAIQAYRGRDFSKRPTGTQISASKMPDGTIEMFLHKPGKAPELFQPEHFMSELYSKKGAKTTALEDVKMRDSLDRISSINKENVELQKIDKALRNPKDKFKVIK